MARIIKPIIDTYFLPMISAKIPIRLEKANIPTTCIATVKDTSK